jgi:phosphatidylserine synthase
LIYVYFASGMALLANGVMASRLRYGTDKRVPATILVISVAGIFGLLAFANWDTFKRPLSARKWILLCVLASLGILVLIFAPTEYGGSGA